MKRSSNQGFLAVMLTCGLIVSACSSNSDSNASDGANDEEDTNSEAAGSECPHENDTVQLFGPYEANQPAGVNWRAGVDHAIRDINAEGGILDCEVVVEWQDTQGDPDISKQVVAEGAENDPYAIMGPVFSSSTIVNMVEAQRAEIPQIVGSEAPNITDRAANGDNNFIFRTSFGSDQSAIKLVKHMQEQGIESVDIIYKNDEFGVGGATAHTEEFINVGIEIGEEIVVQPEQVDLSVEVSKLKESDSDAVFVFFSEIENGAFHSEVAIQDLDKQLYGADPLVAGASIDLADPGSADGAIGHVGVVATAPLFEDWLVAHNELNPDITSVDHNNIKGYMGVYYIKEVTERMEAFDRAGFSSELHCATITTEDEPGVLLDVAFDANGDMDRESFMVEVQDDVATTFATVPMLDNLSERGC